MANSFNELFGIGSHSGDGSLLGFWPLQETTGTTASDESGNDRDGTISGMGSNPVTAAGPNGWLPSAFDFDGVDDGVMIPHGTWLNQQRLTMFGWFRSNATQEDQAYLIGRPVATSPTRVPFRMYFRVGTTGAGEIEGLNAGFFESTSYLAQDAEGIAITNDQWFFYALTIKDGPDNLTLELQRDGTVVDSQDYSASVPIASVSLRIGSENNRRFFNGRIAGCGTTSRAWTKAERGQTKDGPEPINTVAPGAPSGTATEGETLTAATGTWGLPSPFSSGTNGTITYAYQWTRSNDASGTGEVDISGATSATYTLVSADVGKFIRCRIRASNTGGHDPDADTNGGLTAEIQAAGGGGGTYRRRQKPQLIGCGVI